jgi:tetratricopeptide (TPR) repeat protein
MVGYPKLKKGIVIFTNSNNGLSIAPQIIEFAMQDQKPLLAWLASSYPAYDSPVNAMYRAIKNDGIEAGLRLYRTDPHAMNEGQINGLGYRLLQSKKIEEAIEIFKLNMETYPQSWNVYDSLGEVYLVNGNTELAIKNYEKSIALNPDNTNGVTVLKKIREKQKN